MKIEKWFVYDPEGDGYNEFPTEEAALKDAEKCIRLYLDDGWHEDVDRVTVGKVTHRATQFNLWVRPPEDQIDSEGTDEEGTYWDGDWDHMCNYRMEAVNK